MIYDSFRFIYPPRPLRKIRPADLSRYDNGEFIAQPKYDGDCCVPAVRQEEFILRNRHDEPKAHKGSRVNFQSLSNLSPGWMLLCAEILDKAKRDEHGEIITGIVLFDILVYDGKYLVGSTLQERLDLLDNLFPSQRMAVTPTGMKQYKHLLFTQFPDIYKAPVYTGNFVELYDDLVKTQLYEGIVLKKKDAKLELGFHEDNNSNWQLKARRKTKNFSF